jgi:alanine racemase
MAAPGVHVKVDTGMHRVGLLPERVVPFVESLLGAGLALEGLWTHLATAEEPANPFTAEQLRRFHQVAAQLADAGIRPRYLHAANTAAIMAGPAYHLDLVRLGIGMYGLSPGDDIARRFSLRPALSLRSAVALVKRLPAGERLSYGQRYELERPSTVATVPVGYADGYRRSLGGVGEVLIGGRRLPVAGAVTMDQLMVDCGDHTVEVGDEVVLIGRQGDDEITAEEMAAWIDTISYEVVAGIGARVPRVYVGARSGRVVEP